MADQSLWHPGNGEHLPFSRTFLYTTEEREAFPEMILFSQRQLLPKTVLCDRAFNCLTCIPYSTSDVNRQGLTGALAPGLCLKPTQTRLTRPLDMARLAAGCFVVSIHRVTIERNPFANSTTRTRRGMPCVCRVSPYRA